MTKSQLNALTAAWWVGAALIIQLILKGIGVKIEPAKESPKIHDRCDISEDNSIFQTGNAYPENRGRNAIKPWNIPLKGWKDIALRVKNQISKDNASLVSAGVAFYIVLAMFPALAALVSLYGLFTDPGQIQGHIMSMGSLLPEEARKIIDEQLQAIASNSRGGLGLGAILGLLLAFWSASKGMKALIESLNIAYDEEETRGFLKLTGLALVFTVGATLFVITAFGLIAVLPTILKILGLEEITQTLLSLLRWPLLAVMVTIGLAVLYRYGPCRDKPEWQWVVWGAGVATFFWIAGSIGFSIYVDNYGKYNETYGSLGAGIALFMWFFVTAFIVVIGAEINAEMERQTRKDTTVGKPEPMGQRGAYAADNLGRSIRSEGT